MSARSILAINQTGPSETPEKKGSNNSNLHAARSAKNDEFYTRIEDIEAELKHYSKKLKNKVVICNCDDPEWSNFWRHFRAKFDDYGLKRLIATHYAQNQNESAGVLECIDISRGADGKPLVNTYKLQGDGDFRSPECVELLEQADIVITNPPFSLFREFVDLLIQKNKKFLIIGSMNAISYLEVFRHIKENKLWLGLTSPKRFYLPREDERKPSDNTKPFGNICWFTNIDHHRRSEKMDLFQNYTGNESSYPFYDNYAAIEVSRTAYIPRDYEGAMGVPVSFLSKYNPEQFEIVGSFNAGAHGVELGATKTKTKSKGKDLMWNGPVVNQRPLYKRIIIKRKLK